MRSQGPPPLLSGTVQDGPAPCSTGHKSFRLCIALFKALPHARAAVAELAGKGVPVENMYAIAKLHVLRPTLPEPEKGPLEPSARRLSDGLRQVPLMFGAGPCLISSGTLLDEIGALPPSQDGELAGPEWIKERQLKRLSLHLANQGLILIVSSASPTEQDVVCRSLLYQSQNGLQTYDFTRPGIANCTGNF